jgi:hypothetical protein
LGLVPEAAAQYDPDAKPTVVSDRPHVMDTGRVVPEGHAQLEGGTRFDVFDRASWSGFALLGRFGLATNVELRMEADAFRYSGLRAANETTFSYLNRARIGAKFGAEVADGTHVSMRPYVTLFPGATGEPPEVAVGFRSAAEHIFSDTLRLIANVGISNDPAVGVRRTSLMGGTMLGIAFSPVVETFVEISLDAPVQTFASNYLLAADAGILITPLNRLQIDAFVGTDATRFDGVYGGVGAAYLF